MKQFMSILFGFVLVMGLQIETALSETLAQCRNRCEKDYKGKPSEIADCKGDCNLIKESENDERAKANEARAREKELKQECSDAMEKYNKANKQNPCPTAATSKDCYNKIKMCQASTGVIPGLDGLATGNDNIDAIANSAMEMLKIQQSSNQNSMNNVDRSCYAAIQVRDKDAAKERKSQEEQIIKDREAAEKEIREANEKLKEKTNEIKVDQQKLQAETQKALQKLEVDKREKLTKMNEDIQKAATDIRKRTTEIIKIKMDMEKFKFEHQKTMMAHTEEKINEQCKSALKTAKTCFVKASKGKKFEKGDVCENFPMTGSGTKGTAELKKKLKQVKDACFERSNQTLSTLKYDYEDKIRKDNMDIAEKQEQISDANKALALKKTENESINAENAKEKSQEEQNLEKQMANLTEKLSDLEKSTEAARKSSETKIADLNLRLKDLRAGALASSVDNPGSQTIYDNIANDAYNALGEISSATSAAFAACCDYDDENKKVLPKAKPGTGVTNVKCGQFNQETKDAEKRATESTRNRMNN